MACWPRSCKAYEERSFSAATAPSPCLGFRVPTLRPLRFHQVQKEEEEGEGGEESEALVSAPQ